LEAIVDKSVAGLRVPLRLAKTIGYLPGIDGIFRRKNGAGRTMRIRYQILLSFFSLALVYLAARVIRMLYLTRGVRAICPKCGSVFLRPSSRRSVSDLPFRVLRLAAYRCSICDFRFHCAKVEAQEKSAAPNHQ
jgi:hypothetical protein